MNQKLKFSLIFAIPILLSSGIYYFNGMGSSLKTAKAANSGVNGIGKNALVVGGTAGIGKGIAMRLAEANYSITIIGRNIERGNEMVEILNKKSTDASAKHQFIACDAKLVKTSTECAKKYIESIENKPLDILVLTQGIATFAGRTPTEEGIEQKLAIHYYSRMAFIRNLLNNLKIAENPRVLSVLSAGVHSPYAKYKEDPDLEHNFSLLNAADAAGFYNDIAMDSFSRENPEIVFCHAAPGFVASSWGSELNPVMKGIIRGLQIFGRSIEDCAEYMCLPLLSKDKPKDGYLLIGSEGQTVSKTKLHDEARETVWKHTNEVLDRLS